MKILIIGGTKFIGPHLTAAAIAGGHSVTIFTRGKQASPGPNGVEHIRGDRSTDLDKLAGRRWDSVVDTCGYLPGQVEASAAFFSSSINQYVFVSSISAYAGFAEPGMDETAPLAGLTPEQLARANAVDTSGAVSAVSFGELYGGLKALCEQAAERAMPGRVLVIRPGVIVGPLDYTDRFTYWPVRVRRGGEVLAPGRPDRHLQFIDVRDLTQWIVHMIEQNQTGIYNANNTPGEVTMERLLTESKDETGSDAVFTWVDDRFLMQQDVTPWSEVPLWVPEYDSEDSKGFMYIDCTRAYTSGLTLRPLSETIKDTLHWYENDREDKDLRAGIAAEKERRILAKWHDRSNG